MLSSIFLKFLVILSLDFLFKGRTSTGGSLQASLRPFFLPRKGSQPPTLTLGAWTHAASSACPVTTATPSGTPTHLWGESGSGVGPLCKSQDGALCALRICPDLTLSPELERAQHQIADENPGARQERPWENRKSFLSAFWRRDATFPFFTEPHTLHSGPWVVHYLSDESSPRHIKVLLVLWKAF